jgi:two-component system sensor histidine kinase TctE
MHATGIHRRLFQWLLLPLAVLFVIGVFSDYQLDYKPAVDAYDQALADTALALSASLKQENGQVAMALSPQADAVLRVDREDRIYFAVFLADGTRIAGDDSLPFIGAAVGELDYRDSSANGEAIRVAIMRFVLDGQPVWIEAAETTRKRDRLRRRIMATTVGTDLLQILAVLTIVMVGVRVGLAPLDRLRAEIERRSPRDLSPLPVETVPEEVRPLIAALNHQFALLDESVASRDRFLADAAHQLKTPLAALQTQLELAMVDDDPVERRRRFGQMADGTRRAAHLVHQLLALSRAESSTELREQRVPVDLAALAERLASTHLDAAIAKGIDLGFELSPAVVMGVPWLLQELMSNLVDNAIIYTPSGGAVTVRTGERGGCTLFEVEDSGPGIPEDQTERIFERFYRLPNSGGDGCGLGLAIVRDIALAHGAEVRVRKPGPAGALVVVEFPLSPARSGR